MRNDTKAIFVVLAVLCGLMAVVLLFAGSVYWALGFGGVAVIHLVIDYFNLTNKEKDNEKL